MASGDFRDLAETQRDTSRALQTLVGELRRSRPGELGRLTGSLNPSEEREQLQARVIREIAPSLTAERPSGATDGVGSGAAVSDVERTLRTTQNAIRDLGAGLTASTKDLERTVAAFSGGLQSVLSGLSGGGGGGFGGFLKGGFGLAGLGLKIAGLFGKDAPEPTVLSPFELPSSLALEAANTSNVLGGFPRFDRGQVGEPRSFRNEAAAVSPQVVVNVNALDTQSFMDRSSDIARAVRDAMLHMHPINDLIGSFDGGFAARGAGGLSGYWLPLLAYARGSDRFGENPPAFAWLDARTDVCCAQAGLPVPLEGYEYSAICGCSFGLEASAWALSAGSRRVWR